MNCFEFTAVKDFDNHIAKSIPSIEKLYALARRLVFDFQQAGTQVYDIGSTTGSFLKSIEKRPEISYVGIDKNFLPESDDPAVAFEQEDARRYAFLHPSVVTSIFTLQFMPFCDRSKMIQSIYNTLVDGGLFLIAEKVHSSNPRVAQTLRAELLVEKSAGFTAKQIVEKETALAPVMHCQTNEGLAKELEMFSTVDVIWQWGEFKALACVK